MNSRIIKIAHLVAISISLVVGAIVLARTVGSSNQLDQNANGGGSSSQQNSNAGAGQQGAASTNQSGGQNRAGGGSGGAVTNADRRFVMDLAMSGMKEVELSRMATRQATNDAVKQFAQRMVEDHTRSNQELMQLAASKGITLPTAPDAKLQSALNKMGQTSGADFDRRYLREAGVKEHEKAVKLLQRMSAKGNDADLRAFAAKTLPVVQEHLTMARTLSGATGNGNRSGGNANANTNSMGSH